MIVNESDYLAHYGILRKSGRYPWGSGNNQSTRNRTFLETIADLRSQGISESDIAQGFGMSTTQLRALKSIAKNEQKQSQIAMAQKLKDKAYSNVAIGQRMGLNESSVRALLAAGSQDRADVLNNISGMLKKEVDSKTYVDIGSGVETQLGISKERLNTAVAMLQEQGYTKHSVKIPQLGTRHETELKVLAPPGTTQRDVWLNRDKIQQIQQFSDDGGRSNYGLLDPISVSPTRVGIRYGDEGGKTADGVIYVRPGVPDVSLGQSRYAQVRVKVGDGHYIKGMAMYKEDLPAGTDLLFNTNKKDSGNKLDVLKPIKDDPDNPFGAIVRQIGENMNTPEAKLTSAMNIVNEQGQWGEWSKNLSSQFLSKQPLSLAREQLDMTYERRKQDYDDILSLTNPAVKKKLLEEFADGTDSAAVHLKAAALPRQASHVILPIDTMPKAQVYAPNYSNGERVVLVRYPHGGTFEIPELTVNNRHPAAKRLLGDAPDAIGIHSSVAERLSGADFDGDTVLVIPNKLGKVKTSSALEGLKGFDPKTQYPKYEGMKVLTKERKQQEMGDVSNLITDMTIRLAPHSDLVRAVRHSMVVIDADKHELDYKRSAVDNGIRQLKQEYQGSPRGGASTLVSRKKRTERVPEFKPRPQALGGPIDRTTGERVFVETGRTRKNKKGEVVLKRVPVNVLDRTSDARTLSSGTLMERQYANHSNKLKALANSARLASLKTPPVKMSASAKKVYAKEVASLDSKLALAQKNRPRERQAQVIANAVLRTKKDANPNMDDDTYKKIKFQSLEEARIRTGAKKTDIKITPQEWEAIQAGAISANKLNQILNKADMDVVRELATPKVKKKMSPAKTTRAKQMLASGYTRAEVAAQLGVSLTTLDVGVKGEGE